MINLAAVPATCTNIAMRGALLSNMLLTDIVIMLVIVAGQRIGGTLRRRAPAQPAQRIVP